MKDRNSSYTALLVTSVILIVEGATTADLRIIGGQDAAPGQFPYIVSIQLCDWFSCDHHCGGAIVAPSWIVTAAHCYSYGVKYQIVAGIQNKTESGDWRQTVEVANFHVHKDFIGNANPNDIAIIELAEPLSYNDRVQPIPLPAAQSEYTGEAVVSGWGQTGGSIFPKLPDTLQYQNSTVLSNDRCMDLLNAKFGQNRNPFNVSSNVCTYTAVSDRGVCKGDSGGPLVGRGVLVGLTSWGFVPCGQAGAPSVFTRVSNFIDWINDHMNNSTGCN